MKKIKLAIVSSHPIQYNAPMFRLLAKSSVVEPRIFYTWSQSNQTLFDKDFGREIKWDIPLLDGYDYEFTENISANPGPGSYKGIDCPGLNKSIKKWGADALLVFGWNYKAHLGAMRHFKGKIPVYFRGDSTLLDETGGWKQQLRRLVLKWVYHYADGAFYVGQNNKQYFLKHGFKEHQLTFAPHAIDIERFSTAVNEDKNIAENFRKDLGIQADDQVMLFVGKFEPKKNPLLLLDAFISLSLKNCHLVFTGNGQLEAEMKERSKGNSNIHFMPFQNQSMMPHVYQMADVVALPSQGPGETWGLVVNEAMACSKAVLVSNKTGCAVDLVKNGDNGYIFGSGSYESCKNAINNIMAGKQQTLEMGKKSFEIIQAWSFQEIVAAIENKMKELKLN
ncbi:MAG: glycosyltransferase family 4 protein [Lentimicrobium sp.]|jgi:glycosyltransferase involved in cell wall biosynthesis|nr:glycosyltransferase family 4 protein [Lentimicrobium sp.]